MNIGRNDLCPCGSGKKYKKCCINGPNIEWLVNTRMEPRNDLSDHPSQTPTLFGFPGSEHLFSLQATYSDPDDPRNYGGLDGLPGKYKVIFTLCRPGFSPLPENQISFAETLVGDSHLLIGPPTTDQADEEPSQITFSASTKDGEFEFTGYPNSKGCLERIVLESINAGDFHQATMKAFHGLMPALSQMSLYFDIPFHIYQTQAIELRTNSRRCSVIAPYTQKALQDLAFNNFSEELCKYAALYREAMNSNSFNYQFLCYYKIIEGLDKRRERLIIEAKQRGESIPSSPRLMIPHTPTEQFEWLKSIFPVRWPWGKPTLSAIFPPELCAKQRKVRDVVQNELVAIRNKIAHSVLDDGEPTISIDYAVDIELVGRWLPLTKCIARLYMKEAFPECFRPLVIT